MFHSSAYAVFDIRMTQETVTSPRVLQGIDNTPAVVQDGVSKLLQLMQSASKIWIDGFSSTGKYRSN